MVVQFCNVVKTFGAGAQCKTALDGVSWDAQGGEVFGILGPNGAGKTTMMRLLLDILRPDGGRILVNDKKTAVRSAAFRRRVGYLPEERGLWRKRRVMDVLCHLAGLKGLSKKEAAERALSWLDEFGLPGCHSKTIAELSKGMAQKVQIISCLLHDPDVLILDEPFTGLDPVNVRLIRERIIALKNRGKLILLSTHLMNEVETLCDRILMLHEGHSVLYGTLQEIKQTYACPELTLDSQANPEGLPCIREIISTSRGKRISLRDGYSPHDFLSQMAGGRHPVRRFEIGTSPLEDIFVSIVNSNGNGACRD